MWLSRYELMKNLHIKGDRRRTGMGTTDVTTMGQAKNVIMCNTAKVFPAFSKTNDYKKIICYTQCFL